MFCSECGQVMSKRIFDESEGKYYFECQNQCQDGSICWNTEWDEKGVI